MVWTWHSPVGTFRIGESRRGGYPLSIGRTVLGIYPFPGAAASDVHLHSTSYEPWDALWSDPAVGFSAPASLDDWEEEQP
jgi:hypothetical protein